METKESFVLVSMFISLVPVMVSADMIASNRVARICVAGSLFWFIVGLFFLYYRPFEIEPVITALTFAFPLVYLACFFLLRLGFRYFTGDDPYITWQPSSPGEPPVDGLFTRYKHRRLVRYSDFVFSFAEFFIPMIIVVAAYSQIGPPIPLKHHYPYPDRWFAVINDPNKPDWEILPQEARAGEVILSKRNELGILSNFAATPFELDGKRYASVEGFWQMMHYPEGPEDERAKDKRVTWKFTREQVAQMTAFDAKSAGTLAEANEKTLGIDWVSYNGRRFPYHSATRGEHYKLILAAMRAKLDQNPEVKRILLATGDLKLRPDHIEEPNAPPEWHYYDIWMQLRSELQKPARN